MDAPLRQPDASEHIDQQPAAEPQPLPKELRDQIRRYLLQRPSGQDSTGDENTLGQGWGSAQKPVIALLRAYLGRSRRSDACWSRTGTGQCTGTGRSESLRRLAV